MCVVQKELKCKCCETKFPIWRKKHKNHSKGHIKHMYCYVCKKDTEHIELDEFRDDKNTYELCLN
jgi:hypothetical protein